MTGFLHLKLSISSARVHLLSCTYMRLLVTLLLWTHFQAEHLVAQIRSKAQVEIQLQGDWKVVNMIFNPGEPFYGTKDEKQLFDDLWYETVQSLMGGTIFRFRNNYTYEIRVSEPNAKPKVTRGKWRIEQNGDQLILSEKRKNPDLVKVLLIDAESMELLFKYEGGLLLTFTRL
jgi:hypothetical protein